MERMLRKATQGDFEIERELGRGGMAVVYLATDVHLRRKVAIKVLPPDLTFGKGTIERFRREAQTAAQLDHPNIIPVYRISAGGDLFWYAMKYIEGRSLDEILKEGMRFDLRGCIEILDQVAAALEWAHRRQVIHRDVKPANIMIDRTGRVTMADFGIAKALSKTSLTASGSAIGTPNYMSPEQCMGGEITGAADQYSLGVVAYQMLAGKLPFEADSAVELIQKHCFVPPPSLEEVRPGFPPEVYRAVERTLAKKAAERFDGVLDFVAALKQAAGVTSGSGSAPTPTPIPTPSATPVPVAPASQSAVPAATPIPAVPSGAGSLPGGTPTPTPVPDSGDWDASPTELIGTLRRHRSVGVLLGAAALVVAVSGGAWWLMSGRQGSGDSNAAASRSTSGMPMETDEPAEFAAGEVGQPSDSEPRTEQLSVGPTAPPPSAEVPAQANPVLAAQERPRPVAQPVPDRADSPPAEQPRRQEQREAPPTAVVTPPAAARQQAPPTVDPEPEPVQARAAAAPTGPGTEYWSRAVGYSGLGSPAVGADGTVYVGSSNGALTALRQDGSVLWGERLSGAVGTAPALGSDGMIYVPAGQMLHAVVREGSERWSYNLTSRTAATPAIGGDRIVYVPTDSGLQAIQPDGQRRYWRIMVGLTSPAIGMDGTIYVGAQDGLHALDPELKDRWVVPFDPPNLSSPAIGPDGTVYVLSGAGSLHALERSRQSKWVAMLASRSNSGRLASPVIGVNGTVYVGTLDGHLHAVHPGTGLVQWSFRSEHGAVTAPAIGDDGTIYISTARGRLHAINPRDGSSAWHIDLGDGLSAPTIGPGGTVYVVSGDGMLHAIRSSSRGLADSAWPKAGHDHANSGFVGRD